MTEAKITIQDLSIPNLTTPSKLIMISGQLDESNVDEKAKEIYALIDTQEGALNLIFDLSELVYLNSKGIGYMTDWYTKISSKGGKIVLSAPKENILDILQVVGLTQLIEAFSTLEEAKLALSH